MKITQRIVLPLRFIKNIYHVYSRDNKNLDINSQFKSYSKWVKSFQEEPVLDGIPWVCYSAVEFLKGVLNKDMKVFEFGSGNSTLFYAASCKEVHSVEHNKEWYELLQKELKTKSLANISVKLIPPVFIEGYNSDPSLLTSYGSDASEYPSMSFESYVNEIQNYPDDYFDVIFVDGRARPACVAQSFKKLKSGGLFILDNSERPRYQNAINMIDGLGWTKKEFFGPIPRGINFSKTTVWIKKVKIS